MMVMVMRECHDRLAQMGLTFSIPQRPSAPLAARQLNSSTAPLLPLALVSLSGLFPSRFVLPCVLCPLAAVGLSEGETSVHD